MTAPASFDHRPLSSSRCVCGKPVHTDGEGELDVLRILQTDTWERPVEVGTPVIGETTDGQPIRLSVTAIAADGTLTIGAASETGASAAQRTVVEDDGRRRHRRPDGSDGMNL